MEALRGRLANTPPSIGGVALGCAGLAATMGNVNDFFRYTDDLYFLNLVSLISGFFFLASTCTMLVVGLRMVLIPAKVGAELQAPGTISPYGAAVIALALLGKALVAKHPYGEEPVPYAAGESVIWLAFILQERASGSKQIILIAGPSFFSFTLRDELGYTPLCGGGTSSLFCILASSWLA